MGAEATFSREELEAMGDEERQAIEAEMEGDVDTQEGETSEQEADGADNSGEQDTEGTENEEGAGDEAETETEEEAAEEKAGQEASGQDVEGEGEGDAEKTGEEAETEGANRPKQEEDAGDQEGEAEKAAEETPDPNQEKKQEVQDNLTKLKENFEEGEISFEEYLDQRDALKDELRELEISAKVRQEIEEDRKQQTQAQLEQQWQSDQKAFFDANKDISQDKNLLKAFQQQANIKINDPAYDSVGNTDLLEEAAREARAIRGVAAPTSKNSKTDTARRNAAKKDAGDDVQTLSGVPAAAEHDDKDAAEFAALEKLMEQGKSEQLEKELAKLTPEQEARFLRQ